MKKYLFNIASACMIVVLAGCVSSAKVEKSPIKTYVMPCSELVSGDGVLRAWASGKSDSEMSARKKAQIAAAADLAAAAAASAAAAAARSAAAAAAGAARGFQ